MCALSLGNFYKTLSCVLIVSSLTNCQVNIIPRSVWRAQRPRSTRALQGIAVYAAIHHSASASCNNKAACEQLLRNIQQQHINQNFGDIGYNFIITPDGSVYEGQGWGKAGAHAIPVNSRSIGICLIGTFTNTLPTLAARQSTQRLITMAVNTNRLSRNYKLIGHRGVSATECPGRTFYNEISKWPRFSNRM